MAEQKPNSPQVAPPDELYTVLLIIAAAILLIGIIFVGVQSYEFYGSLWPAKGG